ncbi:MFS general substrate transporter [Teratosphaeria nubilosa]|uniref:MFS general substrate transporter n=1 Tax=Teratosphaeria nubilosa TaxID=161662 RepID=A0A6G1LLV9_9PEZI|nr:MFS general substrate transporter [Teratosphaeria nubilosa]
MDHRTSPTKQCIVHFERNDPYDPRNWPSWKKLLAWLPIIPIDLCVSFGASGYSPATTKFAEAFNVSSEVAILGLSLYTLALAFGPMLNAPLSEYFGRLPVYIISYGVSLPFFVGCALAPNLGGYLVMRFLCGLFQSVTIANLGGTIADLYEQHETGYPMSIFIWAATGGSSIGFFLMAFVAQFRPWYDVFGHFWASLSIDVAKEHRPKGIKDLVITTQLRPFRFLLSEAIIFFLSLFSGYLYGISFLLNGAFTLVFGPKGHGLDTLQVGLCFLGIAGGISIGPLTNILQERYYARRIRQANGANIPEARVMMSKIAVITFPISLFWFAWTTYRSINPAVPVLATALWGWSFYTILLMTYEYTEDSYQQYAASALAGLGFIRNIPAVPRAVEEAESMGSATYG